MLNKLVISLLKVYQNTLSPILGPRCRFYPTCSQYGVEATHRYGALRGLALTLRRLGKCHPWHEGGIDLVP